MTYQHRPLSKILAPAADPQAEGPNPTDRPRDPTTGKFVSPDAQAKPTNFELPEKYQGKSAEEIAQMHINAERELGRVRNEIGTYRGLVNDLTSLQRTPTESKSVEKDKVDVSGDELLANPAEAIDKVVTHRLNEKAQADAEVAQQTQFEVEGTALMQAFPDIDAIVATPEFQQFAARTPSRQADFQTAASGEGLSQVRAARRLLEDYKDFQEQVSTANDRPAPKQTPTPRIQSAESVATEGPGGAGAVSPQPLIYEADVIKLIHTDPVKYRSPSFQTELMTAMREGRYVKSG